ncbi:elongation factor 1-alpha [Exophiala aquamarina CBS 119918]|uniref:Elongation factor 1 alpha-like protein n=1 Tax=Exophiala aquamarina CBS 119918 TaxID=1182545 RepID=A0A072P3P7_9EURO|nr:elongation factor 1-alpha [Exophiala aquamarina CBS 119918]KEF54481.1 elongation factor 1-alpha [Exophiala aquamarina CBS 119918]
MSNRRVKSMAVDDDDDYDDYDDYNEQEDPDTAGDELSAEDKEHMRQGTIEIRRALGPNFSVTDNEIQEALWHYYYDVSKSVTYIKSVHSLLELDLRPWLMIIFRQKAACSCNRNQKVKFTKDDHFHSLPSVPARSWWSWWFPNGLFEHASDEHQEIANSTLCSMPFSAAEFFKDSPWLRVPEHRKAEITIQPAYPRRGLLGGASKGSKMSKLAALAAKRKQQANEPSGSVSASIPTSRDDYTANLNKLRIGKPAKASHEPEAPGIQKRLLGEELVKKDADDDPRSPGKKCDTSKDQIGQSILVDPNIRGRPSAFASIMTSQETETESRPSSDILSEGLLTKLFDFTEPSPDDIVTKAQNVKDTAPTKSKAKENIRPNSSLANGVQKLSIQELPKIKSKNIDVVVEYNKVKRKNAANFVVIGHVDAGKSTLMGRLLFDLKAVDQRTMEKYQKEAERIGKGSFAFAWVLDQGTEERARGVTIDIATNNFETEKTSFTILDAPGHRDFVPNMIAGASQADFAVLVIDASTGNFESGLKGQTKEHALLVRSIGVQRIIVAVNKMDVSRWSEDRFREIQQQMASFLHTAGFQPKNVTFIPCSGLEGGNILSRPTDSRASWYTGPTLVQELDTSEPSTYALDKPLRMTISDVFRGGVQNPLSVSGRLEAGNVQIGEQVIIMPSGENAQIRSLEVDEEPQDWAVAGQNVVLHLSDVDPIHLKTGDVLCSPTSPMKNVSEFKAKILAFDHLTPMNVDVHKGRLHVPGRITQLIGTLDKSSGAVLKKKPKIVQPGNVVRVVVQLEQAVPLEAPARIVLRANGETVAAGLIE